MNANKTFLTRMAMVAIASLVVMMPPEVDAGSFGSAFGKAALAQFGKRSASKSFGRVSRAQIAKMKRGVSAGQKPRDVIISRARHPQAAAHIELVERLLRVLVKKVFHIQSEIVRIEVVRRRPAPNDNLDNRL